MRATAPISSFVTTCRDSVGRGHHPPGAPTGSAEEQYRRGGSRWTRRRVEAWGSLG